MARAISPQMAATLAQPHAEYWMVEITIAGVTYAFWDGDQPWVWSGRTYQPGGLIELGDIEEAEGTEARSMTMTLRAGPDTALSPDILATIDSQPYTNAPIVRRVAVFDADGAFVGVVDEFRGRIDTVEEEESVDQERAVLTANCVSGGFGAQTASAWRLSTTDHGRWSSGDRFFAMLDKAWTEKLDVGRKTS